MLITQFGMSERRACRLMDRDRTRYRYQGDATDRDQLLRDRLVELARHRPRYGYRRLCVLLRREGWHCDHKRLYRRYRQAGLAMRGRRRTRLRRAMPLLPRSLREPNEEWAMDFISDGLASGQAIRALTVLDHFTRECVAIEVDTSLSGERVARVLSQVGERRGWPQRSIVDNGPAFTSRCLTAWCEERGLQLTSIQPGKPVQNAFIASFNGRLRDECLNASWLRTLPDAKTKIAAWREEYNRVRPHSSLGYLTPYEFAQREILAMTGG